MAITGTGHNGLTTFSLENETLTLVGPGGTFEVQVGDKLNDLGTIVAFNPLTEMAGVRYDVFGTIEYKDIPLGELNPSISAFVSSFTEPVHTA